MGLPKWIKAAGLSLGVMFGSSAGAQETEQPTQEGTEVTAPTADDQQKVDMTAPIDRIEILINGEELDARTSARVLRSRIEANTVQNANDINNKLQEMGNEGRLNYFADDAGNVSVTVNAYNGADKVASFDKSDYTGVQDAPTIKAPEEAQSPNESSTGTGRGYSRGSNRSNNGPDI